MSPSTLNAVYMCSTCLRILFKPLEWIEIKEVIRIFGTLMQLRVGDPLCIMLIILWTGLDCAGSSLVVSHEVYIIQWCNCNTIMILTKNSFIMICTLLSVISISWCIRPNYFSGCKCIADIRFTYIDRNTTINYYDWMDFLQVYWMSAVSEVFLFILV